LDAYDEALQILREVGDRDGEATTLSNLGLVYDEIGEKQKALDFYGQALSILHEIGDRSAEATALNNTGGVYDSLGQIQKALDFYNQALRIHREAGDKDGEATSLTNIGAAYRRLGQPQKSLDYYNQALSIDRETGDRSGQATILNNIGLVYSIMGQESRALDSFNQALPIEREVGDRRGEATTLNNIGGAYDNLVQEQRALDFYNEALTIHSEVGDRAGEAGTLNNIAFVLKSQNRPDAAAAFFKQSVNVYQSLRADISGLNSGLQQSYKKSITSTYRALAGLLVRLGRLGEAEQVLALLKDDERFDFLRRDPALRTAQEQVEYVGKEKGWIDRWKAIEDKAVAIGTQIAELSQARNRALREGTAFSEDAKLGQLNNDEKVIQGAMAAYYQAISAEATYQRGFIIANHQKELDEFRQNVGRSLERLQAKTGVKVAAVYTLTTDHSVDFIVATPESAAPISIPADAAKVNSLTEQLRAALTNPTLDPKAPGLELYNLLFKRVCDQLKAAGISHVMWTLDGSLRYIPLAALWNGEHYLVEDESFTIYSPLELDKLTDERTTDPKIAGFGATKGGVVDGRTFVPLASVREEVNSVVNDPAKHADGVIEGVPWLDADFTENTLLTQMGDPYYQIAHIASHFDLRGDVVNSALLTGDGKLVSLARILGGQGTLADAQVKRPWSHLDLVVLSACDTAGPTDAVSDATAGSEPESFASVVLSMGASSVMASLWSVSDESTALLMQRFYKNWVSGMTKAEALRQAQIAMLNGDIRHGGGAATSDNRGMSTHAPSQQGSFVYDKTRPFAHPYYWAPFLIYGNWR
jgi:CHAT domain-containing protein/Tfp pilus assembly protein PilF